MATREEMIRELKRRDMISQLKARDAAQAGLQTNLPDAPVVQEQSPGVSAYDRFLIKNFATNPQVGIDYLKQKNPGADVRHVGGQTVIKLPGETSYKVLDPDTGIISSDFLGDVGDIAGDVARGALTGMAATAGGLAGSAAGPLGAATGSGVAAAGAGGGLEYLRQKLGQLGGLPQEVNPDLIREEAMLSGVFGSGEKLAGKAFQYAKNTGLPKIAEAMSGVPKEVWQDYVKNPARVAALSQNPEALTSAVHDVQQSVLDTVEGAKAKAGQSIGQAIDTATQAGRTVDITPVKEEFFKRIQKAQTLYSKNPTQQNKDFLEDLKKIGDDYFVQQSDQIGPKIIPNQVSPDVAMQLKQQLKGISEYRPGAISKLKNPADKEITSFATKASGDLTDQMTKEGAVPELKDLNNQYKKFTEALDQVGGSFKDLQTTSNTIRNLDKPAKDMLKARLTDIAGPGKAAQLRDKMQALQTQAYLGDPTGNALSGLGSTSTSRTIPLAGAGTLIGMAAGNKFGGGGYVPTAIGGAIGGSLGAKLGAPSTLAAGFRGLNALEKLPRPPQPALYGAGTSAWEALNSRSE